MVYSHSYFISHEVPAHIHDEYKKRSDIHGLVQIAHMINRDFKYEQYGVDHWSGKPQYRIELAVFSLTMFNKFLHKLEGIMDTNQSLQLLQFLNELKPDNDKEETED